MPHAGNLRSDLPASHPKHLLEPGMQRVRKTSEIEPATGLALPVDHRIKLRRHEPKKGLKLKTVASVNKHRTADHHGPWVPGLFMDLSHRCVAKGLAAVHAAAWDRPHTGLTHEVTSQAHEHLSGAHRYDQDAGSTAQGHEMAFSTEIPGVLRPQLSRAMTRFFVTWSRPVPNCLP